MLACSPSPTLTPVTMTARPSLATSIVTLPSLGTSPIRKRPCASVVASNAPPMACTRAFATGLPSRSTMYPTTTPPRRTIVIRTFRSVSSGWSVVSMMPYPTFWIAEKRRTRPGSTWSSMNFPSLEAVVLGVWSSTAMPARAKAVPPVSTTIPVTVAYL